MLVHVKGALSNQKMDKAYYSWLANHGQHVEMHRTMPFFVVALDFPRQSTHFSSAVVHGILKDVSYGFHRYVTEA